jgi:hypothetical protein
MAGTIKYRRVSTPEIFEQPLAPALAHWFNHQTHHRGQVHALLTGLVGRAPELDMLFYQRPSGEILRLALFPAPGACVSESCPGRENAAKLCIRCHELPLIC